MGDEDRVDEQLTCPIHGDVDGLSLSEGPLSECHPWAIVCEGCDGSGVDVVVGWELPDFGVRRSWEEFPAKAFE